MKKLLLCIDLQNDFIDGSLGVLKNEKQKNKYVKDVCDFIQKFKNDDDTIIFTRDTHDENYENTLEGKCLPISHCVEGTIGHEINEKIFDSAIGGNVFIYNKNSFCQIETIGKIFSQDFDEIHIIGICTDICVVSNATTIRSVNPNIKIVVYSSLCKGTTVSMHRKALEVMKKLFIEVEGGLEIV